MLVFMYVEMLTNFRMNELLTNSFEHTDICLASFKFIYFRFAYVGGGKQLSERMGRPQYIANKK